MDAWILRKELGDPFIRGTGVEIGAGLNPVRHNAIDKLYFADKRNPQEFEEYFGIAPEYELIDLQNIASKYPDGVDFISCHHVVEHIDNPIPVIAKWSRILANDGIIYLSIPSVNNSIEKGRMLTPLRHVIEDWFFERSAASFESKQHIHSFIDACTASGGELAPWFAENSVQDFARYILFDIGQRDDHDLHWHTYDMPTIRYVLEISFFIAGYTATIELEHESDDSLYVVARKRPGRRIPEGLVEFMADLDSRTLALRNLINTMDL